jgi:hypothetical protein
LNDLIDNIVAFLTAAIGTELSAKVVKKGFGSQTPDEIPIERFPYVEIDEGGESVEPDTATATQNRLYTVVLFMAVMEGDEENSLNSILTLSDEVKALVEKEENRQLDGHKWGISIRPVAGSLDDDGRLYFFRGREVEVQFEELEDNYNEY